MCVRARACVCVRERERERVTAAELCVCVCVCVCLFVQGVFTLVLKAEARDYGKGRTFPTWLVMFGQSQCTGSVGQSEQTVLVGKRDFVENKAFERGGA